MVIIRHRPVVVLWFALQDGMTGRGQQAAQHPQPGNTAQACAASGLGRQAIEHAAVSQGQGDRTKRQAEVAPCDESLCPVCCRAHVQWIALLLWLLPFLFG